MNLIGTVQVSDLIWQWAQDESGLFDPAPWLRDVLEIPCGRRRFNVSERVTMWLKADGHCQGCGRRLEPDWHGDHIRPWSRGGVTETVNGQALCPKCNLRKGNQAMKSEKPARAWQLRFDIDYWKQYLEDKKINYLLNAGPGSGKTRAAAKVARDHLDLDSNRVVVVCPNRAIKRSTVKQYNRSGVKLTGAFKNEHCELRSDIEGAVVTYHQVASHPDVFEDWCRNYRVFVVLDEVHHVVDEAGWGTAIETAFDGAIARLMLTGTPFRSDDREIKWIEYIEKDGIRQCRPDLTYSFGEAVADKVVLELVFHLLDGEGKWIEDEQEQTAGFWDTAKYKRRRAKRAAMCRGEWRTSAFVEANDLLDRLIRAYPEAAGLLMVDRMEDAKMLAKQLEKVVGRNQVLIAVSDDDQALKTIERFTGTEENGYRDGEGKWLIFVGMVSEGTDIPRAMVGIHASTVEAPVKCMQFWTRVVRLAPGMTKAHVFLPNTQELERQARAIFENQLHCIEEKDKEPRETVGGDGNGSTINYIDSSAAQTATVLTHDGVFDPETMTAAERGLTAAPAEAGLDEIDIARIIVASREKTSNDIGAPNPDDVRKTQQDIANNLVRKIQYRTQESFANIWARHGICGKGAINRVSNAQLESTIESLKEEFNDLCVL
jgi:superfamily II DNA or RNA helicase